MTEQAHSNVVRRWTAGWLVAASLVCASPAAAQLDAGTDVTWRSRAIWRGLDRVSRMVVQPAAFAGYGADWWNVAAGGWMNVEPLAPRAGERTLRGTDLRGISEVDYWAQGSLIGGRYTSLTVGYAAYTFRGDASRGGVSSDWNTAELYVRGESKWLGLEHELTNWWDVDRVRGSFTEYTVRRALPLFPVILPPTIVASASVGWSSGQRVGTDRAGWFSRDGFRYADVSLRAVPVVHMFRTPVAIGGAVHYVITRDDAPVSGGSPPSSRAWWAEVSLSIPAVSRAEER